MMRPQPKTRCSSEPAARPTAAADRRADRAPLPARASDARRRGTGDRGRRFAEPSYQPSEAEVSPRLRNAFSDVRKRMLPGIIQDQYARAKAAFDQKNFEVAAATFKDMLATLSDPAVGPAAMQPPLSDLRTLAVGFQQLSVAAIAPPPKPVIAAPPVVAIKAPATPPPSASHIYSAQDTDVQPPTPIRQGLPEYDKRLGITPGRGSLEIVIDENGYVNQVLLRGSVHPKYDELAIAAAQTWRCRRCARVCRNAAAYRRGGEDRSLTLLAGLLEEIDDLDVTGHAGTEPGRFAVLVLGFEIGAGFEQQLDDGCQAVARRDHQRRRAIAVLDVDVAAVAEQEAERLDAACRGRQHHGVRSVSLNPYADAAGDQHPHDLSTAVARREDEPHLAALAKPRLFESRQSARAASPRQVSAVDPPPSSALRSAFATNACTSGARRHAPPPSAEFSR
jgi:hypothetical protein